MRIDRKQKNVMRAQLDDVLQLQKDIGKKLENYASETEAVEYQRFWRDLQTSNQETIHKISRYAIAKCNH